MSTAMVSGTPPSNCNLFIMSTTLGTQMLTQVPTILTMGRDSRHGFLLLMLWCMVVLLCRCLSWPSLLLLLLLVVLLLMLMGRTSGTTGSVGTVSHTWQLCSCCLLGSLRSLGGPRVGHSLLLLLVGGVANCGCRSDLSVAIRLLVAVTVTVLRHGVLFLGEFPNNAHRSFSKARNKELILKMVD